MTVLHTFSNLSKGMKDNSLKIQIKLLEIKATVCEMKQPDWA